MIYKHSVKVNGRWYAAGEDVPETRENVADDAALTLADEITNTRDASPVEEVQPENIPVVEDAPRRRGRRSSK